MPCLYHTDDYLISILINLLTGSYPKNIEFDFEHKIADARFWDKNLKSRREISSRTCFGLADVGVRSPRDDVFFHFQKIILVG